MRLPRLCAALLATCHAVAQGQLVFQPGGGNFKLADSTVAPAIWVAANDIVGVERTARDVAVDFGRIVGVNGTVRIVSASGGTNSSTAAAPVIIAGTIGHSTLIDDLVSRGALDVSAVKGKWESYTTRVLRSPAPGVEWALVIAGSDRRGTIYGLYDLSEQMGVSPWHYWADVPYKTKPAGVFVPAGTAKVQGPPSVKYRGFFINDESPALSGWVAANFGPKFNSDFYKLVLELCLRLKGNYLWPAMWGKSFYVDDAKNGQLAHDYGVIMGTSHHEPMARSETEQKNNVQGGWDWGSNRQAVIKFFQDGISRAKNWDTMWTVGMRGSGDVASPTLTAPQLEDLIGVQQGLLKDGLGKPAEQIPQTWVLYKEVSEYYATGLAVPDTVTLLWTDDNSGNLVRVPTAAERGRGAGAGVYYHFDYVGAPRSYKWINTVQPAKTWEQMHLAYTKGARQIWIANVGDIKNLELPLAHFMDMAYDMTRHTTPASTTQWLARWSAAQFGGSAGALGQSTADIVSQYGKLVGGRRKYELLSDLPFAYSTTAYGEAEGVLAEWSALLAKTTAAYDALPNQQTKDAYFQLIHHPVLAGKTVVEIYTKAAQNLLHAQQGRTLTANALAQEVRTLFAQDAAITARFHALKGGKWDRIVNQVHMGYTTWSDPVNNANVMPPLTTVAEPTDSAIVLGVAVEGTAASYPKSGTGPLTMLPVDPYMPASQARYVDIFARKATAGAGVTYTIASNASYVSVTPSKGTLVSSAASPKDIRSKISIAWASAPVGKSTASLLVTGSDGSSATLLLPVNKPSSAAPPAGFKGFVESQGVVSVDAAHFSAAETKGGISYVEIPHYGRTLSAIKPWPVEAMASGAGTTESVPALTYSMYTYSVAAAGGAKLVVSLGPSHNHDPTRPIAFAYSLDGAAPVTVKPVNTTPPYKEQGPWSKAVVENGWTSNIQLASTGVPAGKHELRVWLLEPGVVLQKVVLDLGVGGYKTSALGPPESPRIGA
ncbi:glycosyl hydrolase 115 family protein [Microdochium nivale]|nr:glycosyl hydrolase 115 family protein [Microdochium nivale]